MVIANVCQCFVGGLAPDKAKTMTKRETQLQKQGLFFFYWLQLKNTCKTLKF